MQLCSILSILQHCLSFFGIGKKTDLFQSCGHSWVFQICWQIECSTFTASSFRIWNSSTNIPSPPLALFVMMLPKAHLTSHSRMSGSRWVITSSWLSGSWRSRYMNCKRNPNMMEALREGIRAWGISSRLLQQRAAAAPYLGRGVAPLGCCPQP